MYDFVILEHIAEVYVSSQANLSNFETVFAYKQEGQSLNPEDL